RPPCDSARGHARESSGVTGNGRRVGASLPADTVSGFWLAIRGHLARTQGRCNANDEPCPDRGHSQMAPGASQNRRTLPVTSRVPEHSDELANRVGAASELCLLGSGELDLDDLLDPLGAELTRHAHEDPVDPVLALE